MYDILMSLLNSVKDMINIVWLLFRLAVVITITDMNIIPQSKVL